MRRSISLIVFLGVLAASTSATAQNQSQVEDLDEVSCGSLSNPVGPFDYRSATRPQKDVVEIYHFNRNVENAVAGMTGPVGGDLDYTLRAFPNHPRALMALVRLSEKTKTAGPLPPAGLRWSVECYFERAIRLTPDDGQVRLVYGMYLIRRKDTKGAVREFEQAREQGLVSANLHYNLGLAYFDLKEFDKSAESAKKAYDLGFPLPGLRQKLERAGKWSNAR